MKRLVVQGTFLRSAVARRMLLLFVLAAFVPSAMMAVLGWNQLRDVVARHVQRELDQAGSAYGRSLYDRLLAAEFMLAQMAERIRSGDAPGANPEGDGLGRFFRGVTLMRGADREQLAGSAVAPQPHPGASDFGKPAQGEALLYVGAASVPTLMLPVDPKDPRRGLLVAELGADFLWGDADSLPGQTDICVLAAQAIVLHCSKAALQPLARRLAEDSGDSAQNVLRSIGLGRWTLFLKPHFGSADWSFLAIQPREVGEQAIARITQTYARIALLTVLLVALLSMVQIRRILDPVERLIDATRQLGRGGRLERRLDVDRDDEFGELARSFNGMAGQLALQFDSLKALSALDAQILDHADVEEVFGAAQSRLLQLDGVAAAGVLVIDRNVDDGGTFYLRRAIDEPMTSVRVPVERERLPASTSDPWMFDAGDGDPPTCVALLQRMGAPRCCAMRVGPSDGLRALLVIGLSGDALSAHVLQHARALGDRVVIALTASAREEQLVYQARHDALTRLPNRLLLLDRMALELAHARREKSQLAVMFIDLDRFKAVNDVFGHAVGDQLLATVGERLRACVRESDTVARLGGDEFVVMLSAVHSARDAAQVAGQILRFVALPMTLEGKELAIGASIGIAMAPADGDDPATLLKHADIAMYRAKGGGRGNFVFFEERMNNEVVERANIERELRLALHRKQFSLVYLPRVGVETGRLRGVEALVRWTHPVFGAVSPTRFIPIAEDIGVMQDIGRWVLRAACEQAARWRADGIALETVAVNVSGAQLLAHDWLDTVERVLQQSGLAPDALELEIAEAVLIDNADSVIAALERLRHLGVRLALDDFGTGYSSMGYLRRMPVDALKIDRSFIADLEHDEGARGIARAMIAMARSLRMSVVAEGIESRSQAEMLREWSCDEAQGFYYSEPLDAAGVAALAVRADAAV